MIRDGAAWFAPQVSRLTDVEQEIYSRSEQAARSERRGLWQVDGAIAPWEFVKAQEMKSKQGTKVEPAAIQEIKRSRATAELTNLNLRRTGQAAVARPSSSALADGISDPALADIPINNPWHRFQPDGENVSVLIPAGGKQFSEEIPFGDQRITANGYVSRDGETAYMLFWMKGPHESETDAYVVQSTINGMLAGMNCERTSQRIVSYAGYYGREFDLSACRVPTTVRLYTRVIGDQRQLYFAAAIFKEPDENASKFLKSFSVGSQQTEKQNGNK